MFVKYTSVLLLLWYSLSIIGFDVHSCKSTGEVFVASLVGGITCEDMHPDHSCKSHGGCCADHHEVSSCCGGHETEHAATHVTKEDCCSNDLQVLQLTGVNISANERFDCSVHLHQFVFDVDLAMELTMPTLHRTCLQYLKHPDSGVVMPDLQAVFSIWRV